MQEAEVRCVLVPVTGPDLLIPNTGVAEVVGYTELEPVADAPAWMLGTFLWRGWQVPVISFATLTEAAGSEPTDDARICITKTLTDNERMPYIAILTQGFPRLTTVNAANLTETTGERKPIAVAGNVTIDDQEAVIPDLDRLGHLVAHAAFGALPLTS